MLMYYWLLEDDTVEGVLDDEVVEYIYERESHFEMVWLSLSLFEQPELLEGHEDQLRWLEYERFMVENQHLTMIIMREKADMQGLI